MCVRMGRPNTDEDQCGSIEGRGAAVKALVTGDQGFVGRHMVSFLRGLDWDVFGMDTADGHEQDARGLFVPPSYPLAPDFDLLVHCAYHVGGRQAIDNDKAALAYNLSLDSTMFDY